MTQRASDGWMLGGVGVALAGLYIPWPHWTVALIGTSLFAAAFGAAWAFVPAIQGSTISTISAENDDFV